MKKLSNKVIKLLTKKKLKISFVESCTGGLLSSSVTSISGSSKVFTTGLVTYSNQSKICLLYTSDAADDMQCVDLGGRRIIK